jgi:hypothetical protein
MFKPTYRKSGVKSIRSFVFSDQNHSAFVQRLCDLSPTANLYRSRIDAPPIILTVCTIRAHHDLTKILSNKLDCTSMLIADG